jgi:nucleoside-diphosphate-sugar epimerase
MNNKVLITGSNGFVGSFIVEEAIKQGYNVFAGVRKNSNLQYLKDPRINFFYYDFNKEKQLSEQLRSHNFEYIILNAGLTNALKKEDYFKVNAAYVRKFCKILLEENIIPRKLVLVSSLASYGPAEKQFKQILDNDSVPHPTTWYGESKLQAEQFVQSFNMIPSLIFRPTAVYGPRDKDFLELYKTIKAGFEIKIGFGKQDQSFVYVKDLVRLIVSSLKSEHANKAYFVSDGNLYDSSVINTIVRELLDKKTIKLNIPVPVVKALAFISEMIGKMRSTTPLLNTNKMKEYFVQSFAVDNSAIEKDFNFKAEYDLRKGLEETINWCKENKLI